MAQSLRASVSQVYGHGFDILTSIIGTFASSDELKNNHAGASSELRSCISRKNAELKAYKPPPLKGSDAEGHVQKFTPPSAPKSPEETNLASEMQDYENQAVEVEGQAAAGEGEAGGEEDFFEDIEKMDEDEGVHH
ncbi:ATP synthase F0 subcomplex subunit H atp14 [Exophiala xenobiotica]|nr:ATP synthase F0 subcomplex subunit H atp14 [Exophiala xenobiotica]KAK5345996.1 ATP synthase F0 subcomplex subunit H atp14 [Exophiala xenobiotica]KAK5359516.1 ATP synthase F0 subcomplex subunit H atp14 [Exophiala xenobiotica]KAK5370088.1 ATP synthase F0 subcomplex subunit H atp14 [Exophiala xenobiotica]KAK5416633.1 ATP synthase F0 subcomplex subunit H atp14 [Exophiala xenobiotica]